jgi:rRNA maturation endonuclease Nob1
MKVILDSAVFINADSFPFNEKDEYVMPSSCEAEVKENMAKLRLEVALRQWVNFSITDPCSSSIQAVRQYAKVHGNTRLSDADEAILGLAFESVERKEAVKVYTDDYSIQNALKWAKVPFSGIQQKGITKAKRYGTKR